MKKRFYIYAAGVALLGLASCDLNELPQSSISPESFFQNENDLKYYTNSMYSALPTAGTFYSENVDITTGREIPEIMRGAYIIPTTGGGWSWNALRNINFYLDHSHQCADKNARERYDGLARFFRAYFYYNMVARFGDVPWYDTTLGDNSEGLYAPRDSRVDVMKHIVDDLDYAIAHLPSGVSVNEVNRWAALLLKSRVCLFEGTYRKYHTELNLSGSDEYLQMAADAANELILNGPYTLHSTGNPSVDYVNIFNQEHALTDEVILARSYGATAGIYHDANYYRMSASSDIIGLEKAFVNSYLMLDGSRFTDKPGYNEMMFFEETQNRDPRLAQTIRTPGYKRAGAVLAPSLDLSITGYTIIKYLSGPENDSNGKDITDIPIFRLAEAYLNYAEAKAELGTLSQDDLDNTINKLRKRVGWNVGLDMISANANPDSYIEQMFYPGVTGRNKGVILEIRRERAIEMVQEGVRWNDMMRWKCGSTFTRVYNGMYLPGEGVYDLDGNGTRDLCLYTKDKPRYGSSVVYKRIGTDIFFANGKDGLMLINSNFVKSWNEDRDYLYPIPLQERQLNPNLTQNPGWVDGL